MSRRPHSDDISNDAKRRVVDKAREALRNRLRSGPPLDGTTRPFVTRTRGTRPRPTASSISSTSTANTLVPATSSAASSTASISVPVSTSPVASGSSSVQPTRSLLEGSRRMTNENEHFLKRSPKGTPFLSCLVREKELEAETKEKAECVSCMEELLFDDDEKRVVFAACGHPFHDECLREWHKRKTEFLCPTCSQPVTRVADDIKSPKEYTILKYP